MGTTYQIFPPGPKTIYYTGTGGISYNNSEYNFSVRVEYLYNPFGSSDKDAARTAYNTYLATQTGFFTGKNSSSRNFGLNDILTPGIHNMTTLVDFVKLANSKLEFSTLSQHNLSDGSGWTLPLFHDLPLGPLGFPLGRPRRLRGRRHPVPHSVQSFSTTGLPTGATQRVTLMMEIFFGMGQY